MKRGNSNIFVWIVIGAAVGSVVALLFAPDSGERNRKALLKKLEDTSDMIGDVAEKIMERGRDLMDAAEDVVDRAREAF